MNPARTPALYARFSSEQQNATSAADQLARLREYLRRQDIDPSSALEFRDEAVSGSLWKARPGVQALLAAVKRREVSTVYAEDVDRISRDPGDLAEFKRVLAFYGVGFVSVSDGLKLDGSSASALAFMVKSFTAEQSAKATADKSQRGLRENALAGRTTGGKTYGFARPKIGESRKGTSIRRNEVDPEQAAVVRRIFEAYDKGSGYAAIADALNRDGVTPPRGAGGWVSSCIREMLRNPRYIGDFSFGRREWSRTPDEERRRVVRRLRDRSNPEDQERFVEAVFPELRIIEQDLWERVQAKLAHHHARYLRREIGDKKTSYFLTGLLKCGACGGPMSIAGGSRVRYRCGVNAKRGKAVCPNSMTVPELDVRKAIVNALVYAFDQPALAESYRRRAEAFLAKRAKERAARHADLGREVTALEAKLAQDESRLKKLYLRLADDDDPTLETLVSELKSAVKRSREELEAKRVEAAEEPAYEAPSAAEIEWLSKYVLSWKAALELDDPDCDDDHTPAERAQMLRQFVRVLLRGRDIVLIPRPEEHVYEVDFVVAPLAPLSGAPADKSTTPRRVAEAYDFRGCAGRI
jgi:site-specific DNA recombinase